MGGHGVAFFGVERVARNPNPANSQEVWRSTRPWPRLDRLCMGVLLIGVAVLHVVGVRKHQFIDRVDTLRRTVGAKVRVAP